MEIFLMLIANCLLCVVVFLFGTDVERAKWNDLIGAGKLPEPKTYDTLKKRLNLKSEQLLQAQKTICDMVPMLELPDASFYDTHEKVIELAIQTTMKGSKRSHND